MNKLITLTTDFEDQFASAQLKAVLLSLGFDGNVIENHSITPFSIVEGAFQIDTLRAFCPFYSIHVGIVDPGVGSSRRGIIIKTHHSYLIGPDNGLLYYSARKEKILSVWQINESIFGNSVSNTFHGRDVFIKAAVFIAKGKKPEEFGCQKIQPGALMPLIIQDGQVVHIDHYGNIKIHWPYLTHTSHKLSITRAHQEIFFPFVKTFSDVGKGQPLAYVGSNNTLELAINLGNASKEFEIGLEQVLPIKTLS